MTESKDIIEKLQKVLENAKSHIIRDELLMASRLAFWGVKKNKLSELKVHDVYNADGTVKSQIYRMQFILNDHLKEALRSYANYLQSSGQHDFEKSESSLLPSYQEIKKLSRHWEELGISYKELHNQGIAFCHKKLQGQGSDDQIAKTVSLQYQLSEKQVKAVLVRKVQPVGNSLVKKFAGGKIRKLERSQKLRKLEKLEGVAKLLDREILVKTPFEVSLILLDEFAVMDLTSLEDYQKACQYRDAVVVEAGLTEVPADEENPHQCIIDCMNDKIQDCVGCKPSSVNAGSDVCREHDFFMNVYESLKEQEVTTRLEEQESIKRFERKEDDDETDI